MKRENHLSENLRAYQKIKGYTQAELSAELGVPVSTLQTILSSGNTTLDTVIRVSNAMDASLDELVCRQQSPELHAKLRQLMFEFTWYAEMNADQQELVRYHVGELLSIIKRDRG